MMQSTTAPILELRAAPSSYVVLTGVWYVFTVGLLILAWRGPDANAAQVALMTSAFGVGFTVWLRGFRLSVSEETLEYRDGMRRTQRVPLSDIGSLKHGWVAEERTRSGMRVPRLLVRSKKGKTLFVINSKVFGLPELRRLVAVVHEAIQVDPSASDAGLPR